MKIAKKQVRIIKKIREAGSVAKNERFALFYCSTHSGRRRLRLKIGASRKLFWNCPSGVRC
jgi:hypothetical protein